MLLAIELVVKKTYHYTPQALILLGIGTCFKSPIALFIPCFFLYGKPWIKDNKRRLIHFFSLISSILPIYLFTKLRDLDSIQKKPMKLQNYIFSHIDSDYIDLAKIYLDNYKYILIIIFICLFIFLRIF